MRALVKKEPAVQPVEPPPTPATPVPAAKTETKTTAPDKPKTDGFRWGFLGAN